MSEDEIKRIDTKVVYKNRWMTVREDRLRRPNGDHGLFGVVEKPDFSLIVPFDGERFYLVEQYRYPVNGRYWEFPQGSLEQNVDATPAQVAAAELAEETGLKAERLVKLNKLYQAYGYSTQGIHVFLALELTQGQPDITPEEAGLVCKAFSRTQIDAMVADGQIQDLATVAALQLYDRYTVG